MLSSALWLLCPLLLLVCESGPVVTPFSTPPPLFFEPPFAVFAQDDVETVEKGSECGIRLVGFHEFAKGDVIESFTVESVVRAWDDVAGTA